MLSNVQICFVKVTVLMAEPRTRQRKQIQQLMKSYFQNELFDSIAVFEGTLVN